MGYSLAAMGGIIALGLAAAVYPQLLAAVVLILTRPSPRLLLWACYAGALVVNVGANVAVLAVFNAHDSLLGSDSHHVGPAVYLVIGVLAVALAALAVSPRGREMLGRDPPWSRRRPAPEAAERPGRSAVLKARADQALREGSVLVALAVGAILGVPGPFDVIAVGHLAHDDHAGVAKVVAIVVFSLIKFLLIEAPIVSYAVRPQATAAAVDRFSAWMKANKLEVVAGVVGVIGVGLVVQGVTGLS